jgi:uncharacterized membrane protein
MHFLPCAYRHLQTAHQVVLVNDNYRDRLEGNVISGLLILGILLLYVVGIVCILFPKQMTKVIQNIIDYLIVIHSKRMNTEVSEEDVKIRPKFSIFVGIAILLVTAFAQAINR